jgi:RNA polymerase sigma-70 factor (ECF subfamily)
MEPGLEERIHGLMRTGDLRAAASASVEAYGPEVLGFLVTWLRDANDASEVFSQTCEDLWAGLPRFEGRCSLRTWFYTLARHAASRFHRVPDRDPRRRVPLSEMVEVAERVRSTTLPHLRTEVKDRFAAIRESLPEADRALLVLRVDREMSWNDIARVFSGEDPSHEGLARVSARLRKRFQLVKEEVRMRAQESGLLPHEGS